MFALLHLLSIHVHPSAPVQESCSPCCPCSGIMITLLLLFRNHVHPAAPVQESYQIKSNQKNFIKVIGILHINLLTSIFKQKQQGKKTYTKLKNYIPIGVCTAPWQCKKNPPPTSSVPLSPTFFWLSHLNQKKGTFPWDIRKFQRQDKDDIA